MEMPYTGDSPTPDAGQDKAAAPPVPVTDRIPADAEYWLALSRLPGVGRATFLKLVQAYRSPRAAWEVSDAEWLDAGLVRSPFSTQGVRSEALAWAKTQVDRLAKSDWLLVVFGDSRYPSALSELRHPPPYFFIRGERPSAPAIAIVGSRQATDYAVRATRAIAGDLAAAGLTIVSGFARGVDTVAHKAALEASGRTVAVWGCGPDIVYPHENAGLVAPIASTGCIITEFPFGAPPDPHNFPVRNRLIAGLSDGVLVVQARRRSGALLTAQHALEQGKDVYAVPGEIGQEQFVGTHELLKQGARIVTDASDILSDFQLTPVSHGMPTEVAARPLPPMSDIERRVFDAVGGSPCHVDRLAVSLRLSVGECARVLTLLELKGLIRKSAGNMIARSP